MTDHVSTDNYDYAESTTVVDGNAAAGEFAGIFASDPTTVNVRCGSCSMAQTFAQLKAYVGGPGTVLRCRECDSMVARLARTPQGTWLDLSGSSVWLFQPATS
jgi:hypothetical protein